MAETTVVTNKMNASTHQGGEEELSPEQVFALLWTDEAFHDMALEGADGVRVTVNRKSLAAKSQVLRKMLMGEFSEATNDVVKIGEYSGAVLRALVEYTYTGTTAPLAKLIRQGAEASVENPEALVALDEFQLLLSLNGAADYFILPRLCEMTHAAISDRFRLYPTLALVFLEACRQASPALPKNILDQAWSAARSDVGAALNMSAQLVSSASFWEEILRDDKLLLNDYQKFEALNKWQAFNQETNQLTAKTLVAEYVCLDRIDPQVLSTTVASSELASIEQLAEAYKQQALAAKELYCVDFAERPLFRMTQDDLQQLGVLENSISEDRAQVLNTPSMVAGTVHRWSFNVKRLAEADVGIAKSGETLTERKFVGGQASSWGLNNRGRAYNADKQCKTDLPKFHAGSVVTLMLNLLPDGEYSGTLRASVDGGEWFLIFDSLLGHLDEEGFVPAASVNNGSIRLVSFEKLSGSNTRKRRSSNTA